MRNGPKCKLRSTILILVALQCLGLLFGCMGGRFSVQAPAIESPHMKRGALPGQGLALTGCSDPGGPSLVAGPYIASASETSATIMFQTGGRKNATVFFLECEEDCSEKALFTSHLKVKATLVDQSMVPYTKPGDLIPQNLYFAKLDLSSTLKDRRFFYGIQWKSPDYAPDSKNRYFCMPDIEKGIAGTSFVIPGSEGHGFSFYVYGDTRDPKGFSRIHQQVVENIIGDIRQELRGGRMPAGFVLNQGDFAITGCLQPQWLNNFFSPTRALFQHLPIFTTPGNHEYYSEEGGPQCPKASFYFGYFGQFYDPDQSSAPGLYSFDYKNARFISLNLTADDDWGGALKNTKANRQSPPSLNPAECKGSEQCGHNNICGFKWLQCRLVDAQKDDSIDHVFIFYHAPMITAPPAQKHGSSDFQINTLAGLFERPDGLNPGKVTAVFSGHNHFYERSGPITSLCLADNQNCRDKKQPALCPKDTQAGFNFPPICYTENPNNGISYIISGGGGAKLYDAPQPMVWLESAHSAYSYTKISIKGQAAGMTTQGFDVNGKTFQDKAVLR